MSEASILRKTSKGENAKNIEQLFQHKDKSISTVSFDSGKLKKLKKFLPKPKPEVSAKLHKAITPKIVVQRRDFSNGPIEQVTDFKHEVAFNYPEDLKIFGYQLMNKTWRKSKNIIELKKHIADKKTFWGTLNDDIYGRLRVDDPPNDSSKYILDIDTQFKELVKGRPIKDTLTRSYMEMVREALKMKITIGYREDDIAHIDATLITEQRMIELINKNFQKYIEIFEEFLYRDHESGVGLLRRSYKVNANLADLDKTHKETLKKLKGLKMSLYRSEGLWRTCKLNQKFLYEISPLHWKKEEQDTFMASEVGENKTKTFLEFLDMLNADTEITLDMIVQYIDEECRIHEKPALYFTDPQQILDLFSYMEQQNFNSLVHNESLQQPLAVIREDMVIAERNFDNTIQNLQSYINNLEIGIKWEEERLEELEASVQSLIFIHFKEITASPDVLNIHCFVEDVYESLVGPNNANLSAHQMTAAIVNFYRNQLFFLDTIPAHIVEELRNTIMKERKDMILFAEKATKTCAEMERLLKSMIKGCDPPYEKPRYKPLMFRSAPVVEIKPPPTPPRELFETERDYLEHFTDYCKFFDDLLDFGIDLRNEVEEDPKEDKSKWKHLGDTQEFRQILRK